MKYILYICLFVSLVKLNEPPTINICDRPRFEYIDGNDTIMTKTDYSAVVPRCLRDHITGEQEGGVWTQVAGPNVSSLLVGSNPCWEWSTIPCGVYRFKYKVTTTCCRDSVLTPPMRKCCASVGITCQ